MVTCQVPSSIQEPSATNGNCGTVSKTARVDASIVSRLLMPARLLRLGCLLACAAALIWPCVVPAQSQTVGRSHAGERSHTADTRSRARASAKTRRHAHVVPTGHRHHRAPATSHRGGSRRRGPAHRPPASKSHGHKHKSSGGRTHGSGSSSPPSAKSPSTPRSTPASPSAPARPSAPTPHTPKPRAPHPSAQAPKVPSPTESSHNAPARHASPPSSQKRVSAHHLAPTSAGRDPVASATSQDSLRGAHLPDPVQTDRANHSQTDPANRSGSGSAPLGARIPPQARSSLPVLVAAAAAAALIALLFLDGLGYGPRHRGWRVRWLRRRSP